MVEHLLAKEKVAGSNPVFRSTILVTTGQTMMSGPFCFWWSLFAETRTLSGTAGVAEWQTLRT